MAESDRLMTEIQRIIEYDVHPEGPQPQLEDAFVLGESDDEDEDIGSLSECSI